MIRQIFLFILFIAVVLISIFLSDFLHRGNSFPAREGKPGDRIIDRPHGPQTIKEPDVIPNEWFAYQRAWPHGSIKQEHYLSAIQAAHEMHKSTSNRQTWELAGPTNIGGRITDLAVHPDDHDTFYVGAASGGVFKTTNNGQSWTHVFKNQPVLSIGDLALDPVHPDTLWVGTGEANASSYSFLGDGVWRSPDAGQTWEHMGLPYSAYIGRIVVDHDNPQRVFVAACGNLFSPNPERGVYRTTNGGTDWERVLFLSDSTSAVDLVQHPQNPDILYAAMWERMRGLEYRRSFGPTSGIWKTTDGGDTWTELINDLPTGPEVGRIGLDICRSDPMHVWAFYDNQDEVAVYRSMDGGDSWTRTSDNSLQGINSSFGWYFGQIRVHPLNPEVAYVLGVQMAMTDNGGNNWYDYTTDMHVDQHAMHFFDDGNVLIGNDGGLYRTTTPLAPAFEFINNLPLTQFYAIGIDPQNPQRLYGGTQDNGTNRTMTGALDDWERILGGDGFYVLVHPDDSNIIFAEYQWGYLHRYINEGSWYQCYNAWEGDRTNWMSPYVLDPINTDNLYFGTYRVWKSTDLGINWNPISPDLSHGSDQTGYHTITTIDTSPHIPGYVIAGTDDGRVQITTSDGQDWTDISAGLPQRWITRVAFDPFEPMTVYATVSGFRWDEAQPHVFRSDNLGNNWYSISGNLPELPVNAFVADPEVPDQLFIGTDSGVFYTQNNGFTWESLSEGIPTVPVIDIKIHNPTRKMVAGTYGCSMYSFDLTQLVPEDADDAAPVPPEIALNNYPNPFNPDTNIRFSLPHSAHVRLKVYNIKGQLVRKLADQKYPSGTHTVTWNGRNEYNQPVASGVYLCHLTADGRTKTHRMQLLK